MSPINNLIFKMIDIQTYRHRIGYFNQVSTAIRLKKSRYMHFKSDKLDPRSISIKKVLIYSISLILVCFYQESLNFQVKGILSCYGFQAGSYSRVSIKPFQVHVIQTWSENPNVYLTFSFKSSNKYAKATYGNRDHLRRGVKNLHLNIRSLRNKLSDVKLLIKQHKPHIFGISECELKKTNNWDLNHLKIPGYDLLLPKSWDIHGFARIVIYVKSTVEYEQITELEHDLIQSIWIELGFKNCKKVMYCHVCL